MFNSAVSKQGTSVIIQNSGGEEKILGLNSEILACHWIVQVAFKLPNDSSAW